MLHEAVADLVSRVDRAGFHFRWRQGRGRMSPHSAGGAGQRRPPTSSTSASRLLPSGSTGRLRLPLNAAAKTPHARAPRTQRSAAALHHGMVRRGAHRSCVLGLAITAVHRLGGPLLRAACPVIPRARFFSATTHSLFTTRSRHHEQRTGDAQSAPSGGSPPREVATSAIPSPGTPTASM